MFCRPRATGRSRQRTGRPPSDRRVARQAGRLDGAAGAGHANAPLDNYRNCAVWPVAYCWQFFASFARPVRTFAARRRQMCAVRLTWAQASGLGGAPALEVGARTTSLHRRPLNSFSPARFASLQDGRASDAHLMPWRRLAGCLRRRRRRHSSRHPPAVRPAGLSSADAQIHTRLELDWRAPVVALTSERGGRPL